MRQRLTLFLYINTTERADLARRAPGSTIHKTIDLSHSTLHRLHKEACSCTTDFGSLREACYAVMILIHEIAREIPELADDSFLARAMFLESKSHIALSGAEFED